MFKSTTFNKVFLLISLSVMLFCIPSQTYALSPEQRDSFAQGVYFYRVDTNNVSAGLAAALGNSCYSLKTPPINDAGGLADAINKFIVDGGGGSSPFAGLGPQIVESSIRYGVNPMLVASIARKESGFGTTGTVTIKANNAFGRQASESQPHLDSTSNGKITHWYKWDSFAASVDINDAYSEPQYLLDVYISQGLTTIDAAINKYAPKGENDTATYITQLKAWFGDIISDAGPALSCGFTGYSLIDNFVLFSQFDDRWKDAPYGPTSLGDISQSGCGPTSMAMVVTNLTGQTVTPDTIAANFGSHHVPGGPDGTGQGSDWGLFPDVAKAYGLNARSIGKDLTLAAQTLAQGGLVVAAGKGPKDPGPFTANGHILVLRALTPNGDFLLGDPNTSLPPQNDPKNSNGYSSDDLTNAGLQNLWAITP